MHLQATLLDEGHHRLYWALILSVNSPPLQCQQFQSTSPNVRSKLRHVLPFSSSPERNVKKGKEKAANTPFVDTRTRLLTTLQLQRYNLTYRLRPPGHPMVSLFGPITPASHNAILYVLTRDKLNHPKKPSSAWLWPPSWPWPPASAFSSSLQASRRSCA
jgi:hypothetical protein